MPKNHPGQTADAGGEKSEAPTTTRHQPCHEDWRNRKTQPQTGGVAAHSHAAFVRLEAVVHDFGIDREAGRFAHAHPNARQDQVPEICGQAGGAEQTDHKAAAQPMVGFAPYLSAMRPAGMFMIR